MIDSAHMTKLETDRGKEKENAPSLFLRLSVSIVAFCIVIALYAQAHKTNGDLSILSSGIGVWGTFLIIAFFVFSFLAIFKKLGVNRFIEACSGISVFFGMWFFLWIAVPTEIALLLSSLFIIAHGKFRYIWVHNVFMFIGIAGVSIYLALTLSFYALLSFLVAFGFYDMFIKRPRGELSAFSVKTYRGFVPGLINPLALKNWKQHYALHFKDSDQKELKFIPVLDILIPLTVFAQVFMFRWYAGIVVFICLLIGAYKGDVRVEKEGRSTVISIILGAALPYLVIILLQKGL